MPFAPGSRLGAYEILEPIADGTTSEVYKATDVEQNRTVAIKVLPNGSSASGETKETIESEVLALSGLSHPNIGAVYAFKREGDAEFIVAEFLEGELLVKRLERGALPLDEAIKAAVEIADALNAAHRAGIVHRSLHPLTILMTSGGVKLLDFGLSRIEAPTTDVRSNTTKTDFTDETLRFMAPEQINGGQADGRSDIFAFGAILYEMVTGQKAFEGKNRPVLIAAISTLDPDPLSKTQPDAPPALDHITERCLAKAPDDRWQTAHDLLIQLRWVAEGGDVLLAAARARQKRERRVLAVLATVLFLLGVVTVEAVVRWRTPNETEAFQFRIPVGGLSSSDIAISPDGKMIALVAKPNTQAPAALFVRQTGSTEFQRLTGTEDAAQPFWSPDSRSIGFIAGGRLKRVDATGGAPKDLGATAGFMGGTWGTQGIILYGSAKGLFRVSAEGGSPQAITTIDKQEIGHLWPSFLPDGQHYLYLATSMDAANRAVFIGSLGSKDKMKLMPADSNVQYADPGYLIFHREATLFAQRFDAKKFTLSGDPLHIADQVAFSSTNGRGSFDVSQKGVLLYFQGQGGGGGGGSRGQMTNNFQWGWINRKTGKQEALAGEQKTFGDMDLSPDEKLIAVTQGESNSAAADIWVIDWLHAGRSYRLTLDPGDDINPVWERPGGERVAFTTYRKGNADIYIKNANGTGPETPLLDSSSNEIIEAWSADGRYIAYKYGPEGSEDIWALPMFGDKKPFAVVEGPYRKDEPQFSYDGKWLAYTSNESAGVFQVYVTSFPGREQKIQVSKDGGGQPRWREDGKELFFRSENDNQIMAVDISTAGGKVEAGIPHGLMTAPQGGTVTRDSVRHQWAVTRDGQRFLIRVPGGQVTTQGSAVTVTGVNFNAQGNAGAPVGAPQGGQDFISSGLTVIRNWTAAFRKEAQ